MNNMYSFIKTTRYVINNRLTCPQVIIYQAHANSNHSSILAYDICYRPVYDKLIHDSLIHCKFIPLKCCMIF